MRTCSQASGTVKRQCRRLPFDITTPVKQNVLSFFPGSLHFKQEPNPLVLPPYETVTVRTTSSDLEDGDAEGDDGESPLTSEDEDDSPSPGNTPVKLPSFPTLTSSAALRFVAFCRSILFHFMTEQKFESPCEVF